METPIKNKRKWTNQKGRNPRMIVLSAEMDMMVQEYLNQNPIKFGQLIHFALEQFVTTHRTLALSPVQSRLPKNPSYVDEKTGDTFNYPARIYNVGNTRAGRSKKIIES